MPIQFELSANDMAHSQRQFWFKRKRAMVWGFSIYGAFFLLFGLFTLFQNPPLAIVPLLLGVWGMIFFPVLIPNTARKMFSKMPFMHGLFTVTLGEEELGLEGRNGRYFYNWGVIQDFVEWHDGALLMLGPQSFWYFPKRAFSEPQWALLREKALKTARPISQAAPIAEV